MLEYGDGTIWSVEIKRGLSGKIGRGFHQACADIKPTRAFVVHAAEDRYPVVEDFVAIGLRGLARELLSFS